MTENMRALDMGANYLSHHGILGQKWGVRRYQNADGTWTKEGLERRRGTELAYAAKRGEFDPRNLKTASDIDKLMSSISEADGIRSKYDYSAESTKKWDEAANLGIKALNKMRYDDPMDPNDEGYKTWFLWEDQTIGLPEASILMANGYSSSFVKSLFETLNMLPIKPYNDYDGASELSSSYIFGAKEGYYINNFVDACEQVIKEGRG